MSKKKKMFTSFSIYKKKPEESYVDSQKAKTNNLFDSTGGHEYSTELL